jgi:hypothetical protein
MPKFFLLGSALAITLTLGFGTLGFGSASPAHAAPTPEHPQPGPVTGGRTYTVPSSIDATGKTDVSDALSIWIAEHTTDGTATAPNRIVLNGTYRVEYTLMLGNVSTNRLFHPGLPKFTRNHVILDLTNATLVQKDATPFKRLAPKVLQEPRKRWGVPLISLMDNTNVVLRGGRLTSTNTAGTYSAAREPWHGVEIVGGRDIKLIDVDIDHVWGDFVYITSRKSVRAKNVLIRGGKFEANGRQGITMNGVDGLEVDGVHFRNVQRMLFDHEPAANGGLSNVDVHDNFGHSGGLGFLNLRPHKKTVLQNVKIRNHTLERGHFLTTVATAGVQRKNFEMTNNTTNETKQSKAMALITVGGTAAGFDGVVITGNRDTAKKPLAISAKSTGVALTPNSFS